MGVYIKGLKLPSAERQVELLILTDDGRCVDMFRREYEAVELQPHGRLIDADALDIHRREQQAWQDYEHDPDDEYLEGVKDGLHEASKQLSTAMTIIEAEGT